METLAPQRTLLAITSCDSYEGFVLARQLCQYFEQTESNSQESSVPTVPRLLCFVQDPTRYPDLLKCRHCLVVVISNDDLESLECALWSVHTVVLVPEIVPERVAIADNLLGMMKRAGVERCVLISSIGTDDSNRDQLYRFKLTEDRVMATLGRWTILREGFPYQALFYWKKMIRNEGTLAMSVGADIPYSPLDLQDLGDALISVLFPPTSDQPSQSTDPTDDLDPSFRQELVANAGLGQFDSQVYTLTSSEIITGPKLSDEISNVIGNLKRQDESSAPINYVSMNRDKLKDYLKNLTEKDMALDFNLSAPSLPLWRESLLTRGFQLLMYPRDLILGYFFPQEKSKELLVGTHSAPVTQEGEGSSSSLGIEACECKLTSSPRLPPPNDSEVELILQLLEYINEGKATYHSDDLRKITGGRGQKAADFFKRHSDEFKQLTFPSTTEV